MSWNTNIIINRVVRRSLKPVFIQRTYSCGSYVGLVAFSSHMHGQSAAWSQLKRRHVTSKWPNITDPSRWIEKNSYSTTSEPAGLQHQKDDENCEERYFMVSSANRFKSVRVVVNKQLVSRDADHFAQYLRERIRRWKLDGIRGIWLEIGVAVFHLVPICRHMGFQLHHCNNEQDMLLMNLWLLDHAISTMPRYTSHTVGVAGCVIDEKNGEVLVVRDSTRPNIWKFPGGFSEPSEDIQMTAQREVQEETGIDAVFESVLAFRQHHQMPSSFNMSDIYVVCRMTLKDATSSKQPHPCPIEIVECQWKKIDDLLTQPSMHPLMVRLLTLVQYGLAVGFDQVDIHGEQLPSVYPGQSYALFHRPISSSSSSSSLSNISSSGR